jgi:hypothetical protein
MSLSDELHRAFSRLRQFGRIAIGRITGTTTAKNGRYKSLLELDECRHFQRVELNALTRVLLDKGVITTPELQAILLEEAKTYETSLAKLWPEIEVADDGRSYAIKDIPALARRAREEEWPP